MQTCPSKSIYRHLSPLRRRPLAYSLVHSCSALAATGSLVHVDSHATAVPTHNFKASSSSLTLPNSTSSFASSAAQHPNRLQHARTLTALHTARELIARVFPSQSPEASFWDKVLCEASDEISRSDLTSKEDRITIVVYAVDEFSGGESLVSALLQDPFFPEVESVRISKRWEGREQDSRLDIEYAASPIEHAQSNPKSPSSSSHVIRLSSSFLASMPLPVRLIELRSTRQLSQDDLRLLYTAHIPIILLNPLTTPLTTLSSYSSSNPKTAILPYPLPPHALLLVTSPSPISTSSSIPPTGFELGVSPNRVLFVDPNRALSSSLALHTNASDVFQVQRYSDDAIASGLSMLKRELQSVPTSVQKGDALVSTAVSVLRSSLDGVEAELHQAAALVRTLRNETSHESADAHRAVFGSVPERVSLDDRTSTHPPGSTPTKAERTAMTSQNNKVHAAMAQADGIVLPVLENMTWWRVLWAPDEVGWRMRQAVRDAWVGSIASGLLPALATLPSTQSSQSSNALSRTATLPQTLRSPVLLNALNQFTHAPSFTLEPRALLRPLEHRLLERLGTGPTTALARAAQVLILRIGGSVGVGALSGVLMFMQQVGEVFGAGMLLGAAAGFRWAIGSWDKMRKMWRADWIRVKEVAERDVEATLDQALEKQVLIVPTRAAEGIEDLVTKRRKEIEQSRLDVDKLSATTSESRNP